MVGKLRACENGKIMHMALLAVTAGPTHKMIIWYRVSDVEVKAIEAGCNLLFANPDEETS